MTIPPRAGSDRPQRQPERERRHDVLDRESGGHRRSHHGPQTYACHELLDHLALIAINLDDSVVSHPCCLLDAEWSAEAASILDRLWDLYHRVGDAHLKGEDRPWSHRHPQGNLS